MNYQKALLLASKRRAVSIEVSEKPWPKGEPYPKSYFGGLPQLPNGVDWPLVERPEPRQTSHFYRFVGQIDLRSLPLNARRYLPTAGRILFFVNLHYGRDVEAIIPSRVIYLHDDEFVSSARPFPARDEDWKNHWDRDYRPWLENSDPLKFVDFPYELQFANVDSFKPRGSMQPMLGWAYGDEYDSGYSNLSIRARQAVARQLLTSSDPVSPEVSGPTVQPSNVPPGTAASSFYGGPYTWADAKLIANSLIVEQRWVGRFSYLDPDPEFLSLQKEGLEFRAEMRRLADWLHEKADAEEPWSPIDEYVRQRLLVAIAFTNWSVARFKALSKDCTDRLEARQELEYGPFIGSRNNALHPFGFYNIMDKPDGVIPFNIKRAMWEGIDVHSLYPHDLILKFAPTRDQRLVKEQSSKRDRLTGPYDRVGHQVLGYGTPVQSAPYDFGDHVLLLQILGQRGHDWMGANCAVQFWIRKQDLRARRFDRAFATHECN